MKTALVTGANGLLGTSVVLELLGREYHVKALVRDKKNLLNIPTPIWNW